jgi:hypothetical protein
MKTHRYRRFALWAILLLLAAWFLPSLFSAGRFRRRLEVRLEQTLGRSVHLGSISPRLLPHPGFSIDNVTIHEDPAFGSEPFARVDHIDCDLALWSLLRGRLQLGRLRLQGATINIVRTLPDHWNVEPIVSAAQPAPRGPKPPTLSIEVQDGRLNFSEGSTRKPFAVTGLDGRVIIDRTQGLVSFDVSGTPIRTDLELPPPGRVDLTGSWKPAATGAIDATLRTRGALLYDWIPLATGHNAGIYGLVDADAHLTGSLAVAKLEAQLRLSQVRRWESLPPVGDLPVNLSIKATLDRSARQLRFEQAAADFGGSHVQLAGTIAQPGPHAAIEMTASAEGAHIEDFGALVARLVSKPPSWGVLGTTAVGGIADGRLTIQGPWSNLDYSGSVNAHDGHLIVRSVSLPFSDTVVRAQGRRIELAPTTIRATPDLAIDAQGTLQLSEPELPANSASRRSQVRHIKPRIRSATPPPGYELTLSTHAVTAQSIVAFARRLRLTPARDLDARGMVGATLTVAGRGWPPAAPVIAGSADARAAQIGLPGLSRPLEIHEARLELDGDRVTISPANFSVGGAVFTGRIEHTGPRARPWTFDLRSGSLDLGQAASWFEALGHRPAFEWLAAIPGLGTLAARRAAGTTLFNALNARGEFAAPLVSYQGVNLRGFHAAVDIGQRVVRIRSAVFRMSTGQGQAEATADLSNSLPRLSASFSVAGLRVENWASHLPPQLAGVRGSARLEGRLSADGTTRADLQSTLEGRGVLSLGNLDLGRFDPLRDAARAADWGDLAPSRGPVTLRAATLDLEIKSQRLIVKPARFEFAGAAFELSGTCAFDRSAQFESTADLRHVNRRWIDGDSEESRVTRFLLTGPLDALNATREDQTSAATPVRP